MRYGPFEKEIVSKLLKNISYEYKNRSNINPDTFAWLMWEKIDYSLNQILRYKKAQYLKILDDLIPEKRGKEQCDCHKGQDNCGCRVNDYNEAIEEIKFAINLAKQQVENK